jgi:NADPH:quinone reductase-like Zn-dependent oxidoreductase
MRAIAQDRYGSASVLELRDIDKPAIADSEVLVRVHAAGVDRGVWHIMTGRPYFLRLMGSIGLGLRGPKNPVRGSDAAGVVEATGDAVTRFRAGDEVFGIAKGSFAEYAAALEDKLASKPENLTFEQAATVPITGTTALQAVRAEHVAIAVLDLPLADVDHATSAKLGAQSEDVVPKIRFGVWSARTAVVILGEVAPRCGLRMHPE